jgi:DNA polymerase (family 10)
VHNALSIPEKAMTDRMVRAMENPYVTMLGHPTGRLLLSREPYKVDLNEIVKAAAATKTIIELNANPRRLDMDWRLWRHATELGVLCSINPDAHSLTGFQDLWFGVQAARKGWLSREDVVNCLSRDEVAKVLKRKRS